MQSGIIGQLGRRIVVLLVGLSLLFPASHIQAAPDETDAAVLESPLDRQVLEQQLEALPTDDVEAFWQQLQKEYGGFLPFLETPGLIEQLLPGGGGLNMQSVFQGLMAYFFQEVRQNAHLLGMIVVLTVFAMILGSIQSTFEHQTVGMVAYSIVFLTLLVLVINSFRLAMDLAGTTISNMVNLMLALIPLLLSLLLSLGNLASATVFHPLILFMVHVVGNVIATVVLPLIFLAGVMNMVSGFTGRYQVSQLAELLNKLSLGALGVLTTLFLSVISLQGLTATVADGVTLRTAKFLAGNFVPVVGKLFADAADTVVAASLLVKNAIGMAGVLTLLFICVFPAIKILILSLIYSFAGAVMQPLGDSPVTTCLSLVGRSLIFMFAAMAMVALMFFLAITVVIVAGNITLMMR
mgnify:CR=1 FL=1